MVVVFQPDSQERSFGPLYQLDSILIGDPRASGVRRAESASEPMPKSTLLGGGDLSRKAAVMMPPDSRTPTARMTGTSRFLRLCRCRRRCRAGRVMLSDASQGALSDASQGARRGPHWWSV